MRSGCTRKQIKVVVNNTTTTNNNNNNKCHHIDQLLHRLKIAQCNLDDALLELRQTKQYQTWKAADTDLKKTSEFQKWIEATQVFDDVKRATEDNCSTGQESTLSSEIQVTVRSPSTAVTQPSSNDNSALSVDGAYAVPLDTSELVEEETTGDQKKRLKQRRTTEKESSESEDESDYYKEQGIEYTMKRMSDRIYHGSKGDDNYQYITAFDEGAVDSAIQRLEWRLMAVEEALQQTELTPSVDQEGQKHNNAEQFDAYNQSESESKVSSAVSSFYFDRRQGTNEPESDISSSESEVSSVFTTDYNSIEESVVEGFVGPLSQIEQSLSSTLKSCFV